jgi:hypothetical protein
MRACKAASVTANAGPSAMHASRPDTSRNEIATLVRVGEKEVSFIA